jgi:VWFA-related protein
MGQRLACLVLCVAVLVGAQRSSPGINQRNPPPQPPIKVTTPAVNVYATAVINLYVVVEDKNGDLISNLNKEDFEITEGKVHQEIRDFARETDAPLTLGIVVDTSPSQERVLSIEQEEANRLVRDVLRPHDSGFVLDFDERVQLLQDFTGDQQLLARAIDGTVINNRWPAILANALSSTQNGPSPGGSHLYDAISFASRLMMNQAGRKVFVLLTDGEDMGSDINLQQALEAAEKADVIIYSVAISDTAFYQDRGMGFHGDSVLKKFSKATGGRTSRGKDPLSTAAAFKQIVEDLHSQYLLGYTATKRGDGSFRRIRVELRHGHSNWRVHSRGGYWAPPE